jgi:hypothetical protein
MPRWNDPKENKFTWIIANFDPDVPGWVFWTVMIVLSLFALAVVR